eukprot:c17507_g1_i2 orf=108-836(-)
MSTGTSKKVEMQDSEMTTETSFIAKAQDGAYKAAGILKEEAKAVEQIAQGVERLSKAVDEDVDKVETFLEQVSTTTKSIEEDVDRVFPNSSHDPSSNPSSKVAETDVLALGWPWSVFHVFLMLLTLCVVILHNWGSSALAQNDMRSNNNTTSSNSGLYTSFSMLLINTGTIFKALKLIRDALSWQKQIVIKVEEDVHEIGQGVKQMAKKVEGVANMVENLSQQVEKEADQIQSLISHQETST